MIRIILLTFCLVAPLFSKAQSLSASVLATSGGNETISNLHLSWTFGEAVINTLSNENFILTSGFQQGERFCLGDLNFDGLVSNSDLLIFLANFGCIDMCIADFDNDGSVGSTDLLTFLLVYNSQCYGNN